MGSSIGHIYRLTTFGESHGTMIGGVIDGCPAGLILDFPLIQQDLDRRKPGQSEVTTSRNESDEVQFVSGVFEGKTTGTPIAFLILNNNVKSQDYSDIEDVYRPSHADYTYQEKYGIRDYRGGGRSSARETACRVVAGAVAKQLLKQYGIDILAYVSNVGNLGTPIQMDDLDIIRQNSESNAVRCPDQKIAKEMIALITELKSKGDSIGGQVFCCAKGVPVGLGEPVFDKLHADLGKAMLSINAVKGFEYGSGFNGATMKGSEHNDVFHNSDGEIGTITNFSGGIQGGISNGETIYFKVAFKPVATIISSQKSVNIRGENIEMKAGGRHDPCVVPRAVPIVEAMTALVIVDHLLRNRLSKID